MNNYITENLLILSCNIDDFNPQNYEYITERLFQAKALDVWLTPIYMKNPVRLTRCPCSSVLKINPPVLI